MNVHQARFNSTCIKFLNSCDLFFCDYIILLLYAQLVEVFRTIWSFTDSEFNSSEWNSSKIKSLLSVSTALQPLKLRTYLYLRLIAIHEHEQCWKLWQLLNRPDNYSYTHSLTRSTCSHYLVKCAMSAIKGIKARLGWRRFRNTAAVVTVPASFSTGRFHRQTDIHTYIEDFNIS